MGTLHKEQWMQFGKIEIDIMLHEIELRERYHEMNLLQLNRRLDSIQSQDSSLLQIRSERHEFHEEEPLLTGLNDCN